VLIGRVGLLAYRVLAGFADESEVEGAKGGGWYAMWWPGPTEFIGVAAVNNRQEVIGDAPRPSAVIEATAETIAGSCIAYDYPNHTLRYEWNLKRVGKAPTG